MDNNLLKSKLLIVDDSPSNIDLLLDILKSDYKLTIATNGKNAIKLALGKSKPDLILLDIVMPVMDGFEVCIRLKKNERTRDIPVIFLTAKTEIDDIIKGFDLGAVDYITKPFNRTELLARVKTHIELKKYREHLEKLVQDRTSELKKAKDVAEAANKAKSEFLANMSHEIRTPINAVLGFTELLESSITDPKQKNYLNSIKDGSRGLLTLINDILDLSRIDAGKMELQYTVTNPYTLFKEIERIFSLNAQQKGLDFIIEIAEDIPESLSLDQVRLRQILFNIIGNAVKFTEKGYIKIFANVIYSKEDKSAVDLIISIKDTGIGMSTEFQKKVFDIFSQQEGQSSRKYGGTGLGLGIAKRLAEMMGGKINLISEVNKGSTFEIKLFNIAVSTLKSDSSKRISEPCESKPEEKDQTSEIPPTALKKVPAALIKLENECMQLWESVQKKQHMPDIENFANEIKSIGDNLSIPLLSKYGEDLINDINNFDIENMGVAINTYPEMIKRIKSFLTKGDYQDE